MTDETPKPPVDRRCKRKIITNKSRVPKAKRIPTLEELMAQGPELERRPAAMTPWVPLMPPRRENFAQFYAAGMTAMAAYIAAGFTGKDAKTLGGDISHHADIQARVAFLQELKAKAFHEEARNAYCAAVYALPLAMAEAEDVRRMAMEMKRPTAAMQAIVYKSRVSGLLKQEDDGLGMPLQDMSIEQLERMRVSFGRELRDLKALINTVEPGGNSAGGEVEGEDGRRDSTITQH